MEQKEVLNDITFVTDHLHSSDLNVDVSQVNRGAQARACFENIGYEFAQLFQKIEELETKVSDLADNIDSLDENLNDKIQDKLSEAKFSVQVEF
tara:strand:- start:225 stop:506 length:282 start_codon:yes stop_codon:yes gene_type:complete